MKIVNIIGGLGNQMFQYAFYLALKHKYPDEELKVYIGAYKGYGLHNHYELVRVFNVSANVADVKDMIRLAYPYLNYRMWQIGYHLLPQRKTMFNERIFGHYYEDAFCKVGSCYYDGYWQNERYFTDIRPEIIKTFTPRNIDERNRTVADKIAHCNSASIHVRHGDFLKKSIYKGICGLDYYKEAISELMQRTNIQLVCIFSNDIPWCRENLVPLLGGCEVMVVDWNNKENAYLDMYLMSQCHHNIIAHSSFSWWGAWLNQHAGKIVIGPKVWNNIPTSEFELNSSWIKI